jgi:predicted DNA-binding ribbon-helix-helix protein
MKPCIRLGPSMIRKYSLNHGADHTSISLEPQFYAVVGQMARDEGLGIGAFVLQLPLQRGQNRSSMLRLKCLEYVKAKAEAVAAERIAA